MTIDQFLDIEKFIWCFTVSVYKTLFRLGEVVTSLYKISHTTYSDMPRGVIKASDFAHSSHFHFVIHHLCSMCTKCLIFHILDRISFQLFVPQDMSRNTSRFSVLDFSCSQHSFVSSDNAQMCWRLAETFEHTFLNPTIVETEPKSDISCDIFPYPDPLVFSLNVLSYF